MRIISSFKDYYDCGQQYGYDPQIIYKRETFNKGENYRYSTSYTVQKNKKHEDVFVGVLGFAGSIYPFWKFQQKYRWDIDKFVNFLVKEKYYFRSWRGSYKDTKQLKKYLTGETSHLTKDRFHPKNFEKYFEPAPIFLYYNGHFTFNPRLEPLGFQSILDPIQAYQKLSMWYGNRNFPEIDIPVPPDKDMVSIKGFDKHSFRKDKG